jgi:hypothetical protein
LDESFLPGNFFMMGKVVFLFLMLYVWKGILLEPGCCLCVCVVWQDLGFLTYLWCWRYKMNSLESGVCLL